MRWWIGLVAAVGLTLPAWAPWLDARQDLWAADDAAIHMIRLYHVLWLVDRGVWFPRWLPDMFRGYGYPLLNYYAPATYYLGWALSRLLRLDVWDAYRAAGAVAAALMAGGCYALASAIWRRAALGVLAAAIVLYGPYAVQMNLFQRGDVPELLSLAALPWLLAAIWRLWLVEDRYRAALYLAGAAGAGGAAILSHNLTALASGAVAAAWTGFLLVASPGALGRRLRRLRRVLLAGLLAAGVSAFFWVPALAERSLVQLDRFQTPGLDYRQWLVDVSGQAPRQQYPDNRQTRAGPIDAHLHYPHQILAPPKISAGQAGLGVLAGIAVLLGAAHSLRRWQRARFSRAPVSVPDVEMGLRLAHQAIAFFLLVAAACWLLTFKESAPVWRAVPLLPLFQFPWRLLGPLAICLAAAATGALALAEDSWERRWPGGAEGYPLLGWRAAGTGRLLGYAASGLVAAGFLFNSLGDRTLHLAAAPPRRFDAGAVLAEEQDRANGGTTGVSEFLPRDVRVASYSANQPRVGPVYERLFPDGDWLGDRFVPLSGDLRLLGWRTGPLWLSVRVANDAPVAGQLGVRQLAFPGWRVWLDGRRQPLATVPYVPEQQAALGFITAEVPPGEHVLSLAFGPTPLRAIATLVSALTLVSGGAAAAWLTYAHLAAPAAVGGPAHRLGAGEAGVALAAGCLIVSGALGYAGWRAARPAFGRFASPPAPAAAPRGGTWGSSRLSPGEGEMLVGIAEAARTGEARVASPSGSELGPQRFVDVRQLTVPDQEIEGRGIAGTSRREWLFLHPPSSVSVDVSLPAQRQAVFQAALSLDPTAWDAPAGDGVRYQVLVAPLDREGRAATAEMVLERDLNPRAIRADRRWVPVAADLTPWAGATIRLTLRTVARADVSFDWAGWGNPVVAVRASDRPLAILDGGARQASTAAGPAEAAAPAGR